MVHATLPAAARNPGGLGAADDTPISPKTREKRMKLPCSTGHWRREHSGPDRGPASLPWRRRGAFTAGAITSTAGGEYALCQGLRWLCRPPEELALRVDFNTLSGFGRRPWRGTLRFKQGPDDQIRALKILFRPACSKILSEQGGNGQGPGGERRPGKTAATAAGFTAARFSGPVHANLQHAPAEKRHGSAFFRHPPSPADGPDLSPILSMEKARTAGSSRSGRADELTSSSATRRARSDRPPMCDP